MNKVITYSSISAYFDSFNIKIPQDFDFTIHTLDILHSENLKKSPLFRADYFTFLLIEKGSGYYTIDDNLFPLKKKSFYFTHPGHLKSFTIDKEWKGFIMTFTLEFLKSFISRPVADEFSFLMKESIPVMSLPNDFFNELKTAFEVLMLDYHRANVYKKEILASQLINILYKTKSLLRTHKMKIEVRGRPLQIVNEFNAQLNQHFLDVLNHKEPRLWNVQQFAKALNIHSNYLSSIIKNETGHPVKYWINSRILSEAKARLHQSNLSVTEIAYELGFYNLHSFSRFFKRETDISPSQFRNN